jgi:hypothetical protein
LQKGPAGPTGRVSFNGHDFTSSGKTLAWGEHAAHKLSRSGSIEALICIHFLAAKHGEGERAKSVEIGELRENKQRSGGDSEGGKSL